MSQITLLTGGTRSGKSTFALKLAYDTGTKVCFIATCRPDDPEMRLRVRRHKASRPRTWKTIEEPLFLDKALDKAAGTYGCVIIDCLTLWVSNMMLNGSNRGKIMACAKTAVKTIKKKNIQAIIVTNEVGQGIVPDNRLARAFRDQAGEINQYFAGESQKVYLMVSGIPVNIK